MVCSQGIRRGTPPKNRNSTSVSTFFGAKARSKIASNQQQACADLQSDQLICYSKEEVAASYSARDKCTYEAIEVELVRNGDGLGLHIASSAKPNKAHAAFIGDALTSCSIRSSATSRVVRHWVQHVVPGSPAADTGKVQEGDLLGLVDGVGVQDLAQIDMLVLLTRCVT